MMKKAILIYLLLISGLIANAQCNEALLTKAKSELTENENLINEFKVKLKEADVNDPAPFAKFSQKLEEGNKYRIRIVSDKEEYNSDGIVRLFDNNTLLGYSYSQKADKCYDLFDFICKSTGDYKFLVTFHNGKAGCAVLLISKIN